MIDLYRLSRGIIRAIKISLFQIRFGLSKPARFSPGVNDFWTNGKNKQPERESGNDRQDDQTAADRTSLTYRSQSVCLSPKLVHHRICHRVAMVCARFPLNRVPFKPAPSPLLPRPEPPRSLQSLHRADAPPKHSV